MKLYYSVGPNPRVVKMCMLELGMELPIEEIDIIAGENLSDDYKALNPSAQSPCLQLDSGLVLAEVTAICSYLDEIAEADSLIGDTAEQRAETRMWNRRIDNRILEPMTLAFRSAEGAGLFEGRCHLVPHAADDLKEIVQENWAWFNEQLAGKQYVCGDRFTLADIQLYVFAQFGAMVGQGVAADLANVQAWMARVGERPSADGSKHPTDP
jgi:glutathione S-transferase